MTTTAARSRTICVSTASETEDDFVSTFHRFTEPSSFFVASSSPRPIGFEVAFTIQLRDGQRMLHGCGPVLEVWTDANGPFGRPGIRIGVRQLTASSAKMFTRLREAARLHAIARAVVVLGPPVAAPTQPAPVLAPAILAPGSRPVVGAAAARPTAARGMKAIGVPAVVPAVVRPVVAAPAPVVAAVPVAPIAPSVTLPLPDPAELLAIPRAIPAKQNQTQKLWMPPPPRKTERQRVVSTIAPWPMRRLTTSIPIPVEQPGILPANPLTDFSDDMIDLLVETGDREERGGFTIEAVGNPAPATGAIPVIEAAPPVVSDRARSEQSDVHAIQASTSAAIEQVAIAIAARPRPWRTAGLFAAAVVVIGLTVRVLTPEGSAGAASRPPPRALATTTIVQVPVLMFTPMAMPPATGVAPVAPVAAVAPGPTVEPAVVAPARTVGCKLAIVARPASSVIRLDGKVVGRGSITIDTPCRRRRVTVSRFSFKPVIRWVTPKRDAVTPVTIELARPMHELIVSTSPGGATVTVDGKPAGVTPIAIKVPGFDRVKVKIARRGYRTVTRTAVTSSPRQKLSVRLIAD